MFYCLIIFFIFFSRGSKEKYRIWYLFNIKVSLAYLSFDVGSEGEREVEVMKITLLSFGILTRASSSKKGKKSITCSDFDWHCRRSSLNEGKKNLLGRGCGVLLSTVTGNKCEQVIKKKKNADNGFLVFTGYRSPVTVDFTTSATNTLRRQGKFEIMSELPNKHFLWYLIGHKKENTHTHARAHAQGRCKGHVPHDSKITGWGWLSFYFFISIFIR